MKFLFLTFTALFFSLPAFATEFRLLRAGAEKVVLYGENGGAVVEVMGRGPDGWPELTSHQSFPALPEALRYLDEKFPDRVAIENPTAEDTGRELTTGGGLWEVKHSWSWDWEKKFADWIRSDVDADFFVNHKITTDCADVAYAFRWIFARINGLPMSSKLMSGDWFTQNSVREKWKSLPTSADWSKDARFRAALAYVLDLTYTHTLMRDSYPVAIRPGALLEGGFQLDLHGASGHTRPLVRVAREGEGGLPIQIMASTLPRAIRRLYVEGYWISETPQKGKGGLLRFRWPTTGTPGLVAPEAMPFFSEEEFDPAFKKEGEPFFLAVFRRLNPTVNLGEIGLSLVRDTKSYLLVRQATVNDGYAFCQKNACEPNSANWENWSTPQRDGRVGDQLGQIGSIASFIPAEAREEFQKAIDEPFLELEGDRFRLQDVVWVWANKFYSSDPRLSPARRWALSPAGFREALTSVSREQWAAREKFLATTSSCDPRKCAPGSDAWKTQTPLAIDYTLSNLLFESRRYCGQFPGALCSRFEKELLAPFDLFPGLSLDETLRKFLTINYDPRHSVNNRREGFGQRFRIFPLEGELERLRTSDSFLVDDDGKNLRLFDIRGEIRSVEAPNGGKWEKVDLDRQLGWYSTEKEIGLAELGGAVLGRGALDFVPREFHSLGPDRLVAAGAGRWVLLRLEDRTITSEMSGELDGSLLTEGAFFFRHNQSAFVLAEQNGKVLLRPLDLAPDWWKDSGFDLKPTKLGWFITQYKVGKTSTILVLRDGLKAVDVSFLVDHGAERASMSVIADGGQSVLTYSFDDSGNIRVAFFRLGERGELVSRKDYYKAKFVDGGFSVSEGGKAFSLISAQGKMHALAPAPGEESIAGFDGEFVRAKRGDRYVVRKLNESSPLFESAGGAELLFDRGTEPSLVKICDIDSYADFHFFYVGCRIVDLRRPEEFSQLTGVADGNYLANPRRSQGRVKRGFGQILGRTAVWLEPR